MSEKPTYLNLGCGSRYHPDWVNLDIDPHGPGVIKADISRGIPLDDSSCDVVYHAAVLEHIRRDNAPAFMLECYRVLKSGGVIRVGVPDLERIVRLYLSKLDEALTGDPVAADAYDWMMLELLDQTVRERGGGAMAEYLRQDSVPNQDFVFDRIGEEGRELVRQMRATPTSSKYVPPPLLNRIRRRLALLPLAAKRSLRDRLLGEGGIRALSVGQFRLAGEVHQWMYDRFSLSRLLALTGFQNMQVHSAVTSSIPHWSDFHLDVLPDRTVTKPDLFFMEATKPRS